MASDYIKMPSQAPATAETVQQQQGIESLLTPNEKGDLTSLLISACDCMRSAINHNFEGSSGGVTPTPSPPSPTRSPNNSSSRSTDSYTRRQTIYPEAAVSPRETCLKSFDEWREPVLQQIFTLVNSQKPDSQSHFEREDAQETPHAPEYQNAFQDIYPPIPTPLASIPYQLRLMVLRTLLLIIISSGGYDARSRVLMLIMTSSLRIPISILITLETETATTILKAAESAMSADAESKKRADSSRFSRRWKIGLASVAGAAVVGITGGLAAPFVAAGIGSIMGGIGLGGTVAAGVLGAIAGSSAIVGTLFGAYGGMMSKEIMERYSAEVPATLPTWTRLGAFTDFRDRFKTSPSFP